MSKWLARVAMATIVRRLTVLLLMGALAYCGVGKAQAQTYPNCESYQQNGNYECENRARAHMYAQMAATHFNGANPVCFLSEQADGTWFGMPMTRVRYGGGGACTVNTQSRRYPTANECPAGETWNEVTRRCDAPNPCPNAPTLGASAIVSTIAGRRCSGGCEYAANLEAGPATQVNALRMGGTDFARSWKPTGAKCASPPEPEKPFDPNKPVCQKVGNTASTECVHPDGRHCITTGRGVRMCWESNLGEEGGRKSADGQEGADRRKGNAPGQQPPANQAPPGMENPTPIGNASTTNINGNVYNTQNYSGPGNAGPGQGNTGSGGKDPTDPNAPEGGDGDDEGDDPGGVGGGVGTLYEASDKTVGGVFQAFKGRMENAPILQVAAGVFGNCAGGGSCPGASWDAGIFDFAADLQELCNGSLASLMAWAGYIALAGMFFFAFKVAVL